MLDDMRDSIITIYGHITLDSTPLIGQVRLLMLDDMRDSMAEWVRVILGDQEVVTIYGHITLDSTP